jgi:hypothetical protein
LKPTTSTTAYEVWLYNSPTDAHAVGAQFTNRRGSLIGRGDVPFDYATYKHVLLSRERVGTNPKAPSGKVLQATLAVP